MIKKNLLQRSLSAIILGPAFLFSIYWSVWSYFALFAAILVLGINEFFNMFNSKRLNLLNLNPEPGKIISKKNKFLGIIIAFIIYILTFFCAKRALSARYIVFIPILFLLALIINLYNKDFKNSIQEVAITILGVIYLALPLSMLHFEVLKEQVYNSEIIFTIIFCVWASDTGGYIFGSLLGRHKLFEKISQKKTWEGVIGGIILSICVSYFLSNYFTILPKNGWVISGLVISVASVYGDLVESMLKRNVGVKDSGNLIPGHGGILDRFDSFLFATICMIVYRTFIEIFFN